jgi:hypothetical protein
LRAVSRACYFFGVRLGTCIALELAVAAGAVGGVAFCVVRASDLAGAYLATHEAEAATPVSRPAPEPLPRAHLPSTPLPIVPRSPPTVFGASDAELLAPLGGHVTRVKLNRGGTSLSLRLDFDTGARAAFKPEQIHPQSDPRREIAAYRIDRMLEIGRVPPAKPIAIPVAELIAAMDPAYRAFVSARLTDEATIRGGMVYGEVSWWIPEIKLAKLGRDRIDERAGRLLWVSYLQAGAEIPPDARPLVEQISSVILYDLLIDNADRWTGSNTMMSPDGNVLYFMDNTMAFSLARFGHEINVTMLRRIQVFSRTLVGRIRALTEDALVTLLSIGPGDPASGLGKLLDRSEIHAIIQRRDHMLEYIDQLIAKLGEDAVLALP